MAAFLGIRSLKVVITDSVITYTNEFEKVALEIFFFRPGIERAA